jgi:VIT1/CCC1 family predicted Fe2+/Mn2+ transporter
MNRFAKEERSLGELFTELGDEMRTLIRQEVALATTEIRDKISHLGRDATMMAVAGAVAFVGFEALIAAAIIGLAQVIPLWLSALIVGVVLGIVGYILLRSSLNDIKKRGIVPEKTVQSLKEDREWVQDQMR